jgi:hypothetical protein
VVRGRIKPAQMTWYQLLDRVLRHARGNLIDCSGSHLCVHLHCKGVSNTVSGKMHLLLFLRQTFCLQHSR